MKLICDAIDEDILDMYSWYNHLEGYVKANESWPEAKKNGRKNRKWIHFSREVLFRVHGRYPTSTEVADHINGVVYDNRRCNLRIVSRAQNCRNRKMHKNNTCGYKGVTKVGNRFIAAIGFNYKRIHIGSFPTAELAHEAYLAASIKYHGEYRRH